MLTIYRLVYDFADGGGELRMIAGHGNRFDSDETIGALLGAVSDGSEVGVEDGGGLWKVL